MNMTGAELKKIVGNRYKARLRGELPECKDKKHDCISGIQDRINALEERREIEAAKREVWEEE